jgi:hypothetical protein
MSIRLVRYARADVSVNIASRYDLDFPRGYDLNDIWLGANERVCSTFAKFRDWRTTAERRENPMQSRALAAVAVEAMGVARGAIP